MKGSGSVRIDRPSPRALLARFGMLFVLPLAIVAMLGVVASSSVGEPNGAVATAKARDKGGSKGSSDSSRARGQGKEGRDQGRGKGEKQKNNGHGGQPPAGDPPPQSEQSPGEGEGEGRGGGGRGSDPAGNSRRDDSRREDKSKKSAPVRQNSGDSGTDSAPASAPVTEAPLPASSAGGDSASAPVGTDKAAAGTRHHRAAIKRRSARLRTIARRRAARRRGAELATAAARAVSHGRPAATSSSGAIATRIASPRSAGSGGTAVGQWDLVELGDRARASRSVDSIPLAFKAGLLTAIFLVALLSLFSLRERRRARRVQQVAQLDYLTGLANREGFDRTLAAEWRRSARYGRSLGLVFIDLDDFKRYNDTHGHLAGDRLLREIAAVITQTARGSDFTARLGGDEFVILCPESSEEGLDVLAGRLRREARSLSVTLSIGYALQDQDDGVPDDLIGRADAQMYEAKHNHRGRPGVTNPMLGSLRGRAGR